MSFFFTFSGIRPSWERHRCFCKLQHVKSRKKFGFYSEDNFWRTTIEQVFQWNHLLNLEGIASNYSFILSSNHDVEPLRRYRWGGMSFRMNKKSFFNIVFMITWDGVRTIKNPEKSVSFWASFKVANSKFTHFDKFCLRKQGKKNTKNSKSPICQKKGRF